MTIDEVFTRFPRLETPRLILRQIEPHDTEALFATFSDEAVMEFYGDLPHRTLDDSRDLIRRQQGWYARREGIRWGITRKGDDEVIGSCGFFHFDEGFHRAETGYELRQAYWRQGVMREALTAIITFGFDEMGLQRIEAIIDDANAASKGVLRSLGFTHEGTLRKRFFFRDQLWDEDYYGLLRDEWQAQAGD
ncbi:MAG TPA: GNAT family protein [Ktedonobacterales bacterium]|nr:GNAT family protein [Ktedonobacterales bacterium]